MKGNLTFFNDFSVTVNPVTSFTSTTAMLETSSLSHLKVAELKQNQSLFIWEC